tara:strand:- start:2204 stop:2809 length:606 start_codon:yes stop_codon:yes gene_type:complete
MNFLYLGFILTIISPSVFAQTQKPCPVSSFNEQFFRGTCTYDKNGKLNGPFTDHPSNEEKRTGNLKDGRLHGEIVTESEFNKTVENYQNGIPHGKHTTYFDNKITKSGQYSNGEPIGEWKHYDNGKYVGSVHHKPSPKPRKLSAAEKAQKERNERYINSIAEKAQADAIRQRDKALEDVQKLQNCIEAAGNDIEKYMKCGN